MRLVLRILEPLQTSDFHTDRLYGVEFKDDVYGLIGSMVKVKKKWYFKYKMVLYELDLISKIHEIHHEMS